MTIDPLLIATIKLNLAASYLAPLQSVRSTAYAQREPGIPVEFAEADKKTFCRFADYTLRIRGKKYSHERTMMPHTLARLMGWETPLTTVESRMPCSRISEHAGVATGADGAAQEGSKQPKTKADYEQAGESQVAQARDVQALTLS